MATSVDERIVAAKFDASDFEKGVDKTLKKLDELKKSLDLKDATKGVQELAEKTKESTDSMSKSLNTLTERFTTFVGMIKQKILSGLAQEVADVFLHMEQSVKGFIKGISTDQIAAGMSKYEQMLASVRTMMAAGESQDSAYEAIGRLREYSDQTSYSLSQMTDALSKLRSAGVDLDTATRSVEGIANACANAGINAQDAQRAFYNLSQAYSSGTLKYTDYRSLELLNMTTVDFKEKLLDAAVAAKTLQKQADGSYKTINKFNKKVTAGKKVTTQNLQDMLRYNFVTSEVMDELFGGTFFFDEQKFKEYKNKYKSIDEAIAAAKKDFGETAVNAYLAAREARSFTDVINTLKDVVSTGWSTTFEHLFGKLEEASKFFTALAEGELADVVYKIGEYRNAILGYWDEVDALGRGTGGEILRQSIVNITDALGIFIKTFMQILPGFNELNADLDKGEKQKTLEGIGERLKVLTMRLRDFTLRVKTAAENFQTFMNERTVKDGPTRIERIRQVFANLGSVFMIFARLSAIAFSAIEKAFYTLSPVIDGFMLLLEKVTEPLATLKEDASAKGGAGVFKDLEHGIDNVFIALEPIAKTLGEIIGFLGDVGKFIAEMALGTATANIQFFADALGLVLELLGVKSAQVKDGAGVIEGLRKDFEGIKQACTEGLGAIRSFFDALIGDIRELLGLTDGEGKDASGQEGGVFSRLMNFFNTNEFVQSAKAWVNQAIIDVGNFIKDIPNKVRAFGANIYETIRKMIFEDPSEKDPSKQSEEVLTPFGEWLTGLIASIKDFIINLPQKIIDGIGTIGNWIDDVFDTVFGRKAAEKATTDASNKKEAKADEKILSQFDQFIADTVASIKAWFEDLPNKIQTFLTSTGDFIANLWNAIDEFLFGKKVTRERTVTDKNGKKSVKTFTYRYKKGFSSFLDIVIKSVKEFIHKIPEYIKSAIKGTGDIISTIINSLFGKPEDSNKEVTSKEVENRLEKPFLGIDLTNIINTIKDIGLTLLNEIARIFTGSDNIEENQKWFSEKIAEGILWIKTNAIEAFHTVLDWLADIPNKIANLFKGEKTDKPEQGPIGKALSEFASAIGTFITHDVPEKILELVDNAATVFTELWNNLYNIITGNAEENAEETAKKAEENVNKAADSTTVEVSSWQKLVDKLGQTISNLWEDLPIWIGQGIGMAAVGIGKLLETVGDWLNPQEQSEVSKVFVDKSGKFTAGLTKMVANSAEKGEEQEEPLLITKLKEVGEQIKNLFITIIPGFISDAWAAISSLRSDIWIGISNVFSGNPPDNERQGIITNVVSEIVKVFVEKLPAALQGMWNGIKHVINGIWDGISGIFTEKDIPQEEQQSAVDHVKETMDRVFKEELPKVFQGIWEDIKGTATDIFMGFSAIFTGKPTENAAQESVKNFGETIYKFITEDLPGYIKRAFQKVMNLFNGRSSLINQNEYKLETFDDINAIMKKAQEKASKDSDKPGFWTFIENIKNGLKEAFKTIGPAILDGLSSALEFLGNIATFIVNVLTGNTSIAKEVEKAYGQEQPELIESLKRIGETIKNFLLDTLPKFLGSVAGAIAENAGTWFTKLFDSIRKAKDKAADDATKGTSGGHGFGDEAENDTDILQGIMGGIKGVLDYLKELWVDDDLKSVVILLAIATILKNLKNILSVAETLDSVAGVIKWTAITIAISAIAGILSSISSIVEEGDPEKIQAAEDIIDKLANLFEKLAWVIGLFSLGKIADMASDIWGKQNISVVSEQATGLLSNALGGFAKLLGIGAGTYVAGGLAGAGIEMLLSSIGDAAKNLTGGANDAMANIMPMVDALSALDDKMEKAISAVGKIKDLFVGFYNVFGSLYKELGVSQTELNVDLNSDNEPLNMTFEEMLKLTADMETYQKALEAKLNIFVYFANFLEKLTGALEHFSNVENVNEKLQELLGLFGGEQKEGFVKLMSNMFNALHEAFNTSTLNQGSFARASSYWDLSALSTGLDMLSNALSLLGDAASHYTQDNVKAVEDAISIILELAQVTESSRFHQSALSKVFSGDTSLSNVGKQIRDFGYYMKGFYDNIIGLKGLEDEQTTAETERKIKSIGDITNRMANAMRDLRGYGTSAVLLKDLGEQLPTFASKVGEFFANLDRAMPKDLSTDRSEVLMNSVDAMSSLMSSLNDMSQLLAVFNNQSISDIINKLFTGLDSNSANMMAAAIRTLDEAVLIVMSREDFQNGYYEMGKKIAVSLSNGITDAFIEDPTLRPMITPVLNFDPEAIRAQMGTQLGMDLSAGISWKDLMMAAMGSNDMIDSQIAELKLVNEKLDTANMSLTELVNKSDNIATITDVKEAFKGIKIVTDTGVLAGEIVDYIDSGIGDKIWVVNENVSTGTG